MGTAPGAGRADAADAMESATQRKRAHKNAIAGPASPTSNASTATPSSSLNSETRNFDDDSEDDDLAAFLSGDDLQAAVVAEKERYSELRRKQRQRKQRLTAGRSGSVAWLLQSIRAGWSALWQLSLARVLLATAFLWLLAALLWLRWPIYIQRIAEPLAKALGDKLKADVEPRVVLATLVLPFVVSGVLFYGLAPPIDRSHPIDWRAAKWLQWLRRQRRLCVGGHFDSVDIIAIAVFTLVQLNCFIGKLLIDQYTGKLAKAGLLSRSARSLGMNGLYAIILSVLLVSRQSFVLQYLRLSSERASKYHVWSSSAAVVFLVLHGALYGIVWYQKGVLLSKALPCRACSTTEAYKTMRNFAGVVALAVLLVVALASRESVRRQSFQRFQIAHVLNVVVVVATCVHYYPAAFWLAPAVLTYVLYRIVARVGQATVSVVSVTVLANKILQLELCRPAVKSTNDFAPGQFVYLRVDAIGRRAWHPFTVRSSPLRPSLFVDAKVHRGFTQQLLALVKSHRLLHVRVDGYYGEPIAICDHMVFVAGGSGITPFLSAFEHLHLQSEPPEAVLATKRATFPKTMWIVWTSRDVELLDAHAALLQTMRASTHWRCKIWLHCTPAAVDAIDDEIDNDNALDDDALCDDDSSNRVEQFFPASTHRMAYARDAALSQPLAVFVGASVGVALGLYSSLILESPSWWHKRVLLLGASVCGAALGAATVLLAQRALSRQWCRRQGSAANSVNGSAVTELESTGLDLSSPVTPRTPRKRTDSGSATSVLHRNFAVVPTRPDVQQRLRNIHSEIQENYGMNADVGVFVSGPVSLQADVAHHASALHSPLLTVHYKSFSV